jgi:hypothetical protein
MVLLIVSLVLLMAVLSEEVGWTVAIAVVVVVAIAV